MYKKKYEGHLEIAANEIPDFNLSETAFSIFQI